MKEGQVFGIADGELVTQENYATLARRYASVEALEAALNPTSGAPAVKTYRGSVIDMRDAELPDKPLRLNLSMASNGTATETDGEEIWLAFPTGLSGKAGIELRKAGELTWTRGAVEIDAAVGGHNSLKDAAGVAVASGGDTGLLEALTGVTFQPVTDIEGACVVIQDVGEAVAVVRIVKWIDSDCGVAPLHQRWR